MPLLGIQYMTKLGTTKSTVVHKRLQVQIHTQVFDCVSSLGLIIQHFKGYHSVFPMMKIIKWHHLPVFSVECEAYEGEVVASVGFRCRECLLHRAIVLDLVKVWCVRIGGNIGYNRRYGVANRLPCPVIIFEELVRLYFCNTFTT